MKFVQIKLKRGDDNIINVSSYVPEHSQTSQINDENYLDVNDELFFDDDDDDFDTDDESVIDEDYISTNEISKKALLRVNVVNWALENNITHSALKGLINIINDYVEKPLLPKDPRTLLKTPRDVHITEIGENQSYWHNGLKYCLENLFCNISKSLTISLNLNMDGLPVHKSSRDELWPILFNIFEFPKVKPMVIGVYHGIAKATNLDTYLMPMVSELRSLMEHGLVINGHKITVKLRCFICDSPARAYVKGEFV